MKDKVLGHIACFMAYAIFGFNIIVTKNISDMHLISPFALFTFRAFGATILFWLVSYFLPKENIEKSDYKKIFMASMLGLFLTQMTFLEGILITTSLDASIISPLVPIFTMLVAAVALKEPITLKKAGGVVLGFLGVVLLILNSVGVSSNGVAQTQPMWVLLLVLNNVFFALYLGIFRPLISKYSVVTFMKWMFLFSLMVSLPFTIKEIVELEYVSIPFTYYISLAYLIVFATCIAYYLIPFGQKRLRPTVVSLYTYLQPLIASVMSIYLGMDRLTWQKILAAFLVVIAVLLVNRSRAKQS